MMILVLVSSAAFSQEPVDSAKVKNWDISAVVMAVFTPDNTFVLPVAYATDKRWHFEPRYNYEKMETFSMFVGYNFRGGKKLRYLLSPMVGGVVGQANGIAPGLEFDFALGRFGLYSEMEYLLDAGNSGDSYFYAWSQLHFAITKWMAIGLVGSRNRI